MVVLSQGMLQANLEAQHEPLFYLCLRATTSAGLVPKHTFSYLTFGEAEPMSACSEASVYIFSLCSTQQTTLAL